MTRFTKIMMGATALSMAAGMALAQSNSSYIDQTGDNNAADILQSGSGNELGRDGSYTRFEQNGSKNALKVTQSGNNNDLGVADGGFDQSRANNSLTVTQSGNGNALVRGGQVGNNSTSVGNTAAVSQTSNSNYIYTLSQGQRGSAANTVNVTQEDLTGAATSGNGISNITQIGTGNALSIEQDGSGNQVGTRNIYNQLRNDGAFQGEGNAFNSTDTSTNGTMVIRQTGSNNRVARASQKGQGNTLQLTQTGDDNGTTSFSAGSFAADVGVTQGHAIQTGDRNTINYVIDSNNNNSFGFQQSGIDHTIVGTSLAGNDNQLAISQGRALTDSGNFASVVHNGDRNNIGIAQVYSDNRATVIIDGNENAIGLEQNTLVTHGARNEFTLEIRGDRNGGSTAFGNNAAGNLSLISGTFEQQGFNNKLTAKIVGNDNGLAASQLGDNNLIKGATTGHFNQVAVAQTGNANVADFSQSGSFNVIGISQ